MEQQETKTIKAQRRKGWKPIWKKLKQIGASGLCYKFCRIYRLGGIIGEERLGTLTLNWTGRAIMDMTRPLRRSIWKQWIKSSRFDSIYSQCLSCTALLSQHQQQHQQQQAKPRTDEVPDQISSSERTTNFGYETIAESLKESRGEFAFT